MRVARLLADGIDVWVIFDNTAYGSAAMNAMQLQEFIAVAVSQPAAE